MIRVAALAGLAVWLGPAASDLDPVQVFRARYDSAQAIEDPGESKQAFGRAMRAFLQIPFDSTAHVELRTLGGLAAYRAGRLDLAAALFGSAIADGRATPVDVENYLRALLEGGRAVPALIEARRLDGGWPGAVGRFVLAARGMAEGALFEAAASRLRAGDTRRGLWLFLRAASASGHPLDVANLALSYRFLGRMDEARPLYEEAVARRPDDEVLWNDVGLFRKAAGDLPGAIDAFRRSVQHEREPGLGPGTTNLGVLHLQGHAVLDDPVEALRVVVRRRPGTQLAKRLFLESIARQAGAIDDTGRRRR